MTLAPGPSNLAQARTVGAYFCSLIDNPDWIRRRVETVHFVDLTRVERRVTLDIDMSKVVQHAVDANLDLAAVEHLPVPLAMLQKTLLLDIDVKDSSGTSLSIATSDEDSGAAHAVMLHRIDQQGMTLTPLLSDKLYQIAKDMPSQSDYLALAGMLPPRKRQRMIGIDAWALGNAKPRPTQAERRIWDDLFKTDTIKKTIADFTRLFMPTVYLRKNSTGLSLLKFRYVESETTLRRGNLLNRLGLTPSTVLIDAPAVGRAEREHLRLLAPQGLSITQMLLARVNEGLDTAPTQHHESREALERGALYSSGLERGSYVAFAELLPNSSEFALPAFVATAVSALLLLGGALYQGHYGPLEDAQSTIALLLLAPSAVAAFLTRSGEHQLLGRLLQLPKLLVGLTALVSLLSAASIVILQQEVADGVRPLVDATTVVWIWQISGYYCLGVSVVLALVTALTSWRRHRVIIKSPLTWTIAVEPLDHR